MEGGGRSEEVDGLGSVELSGRCWVLGERVLRLEIGIGIVKKKGGYSEGRKSITYICMLDKKTDRHTEPLKFEEPTTNTYISIFSKIID